MFITNPKRLRLTLVFFIAIALALTTSSHAKAYDQPARRDHSDLTRLIKKRQVVPNGPVIGAGANPPTDSSTISIPPSSKPPAPDPNPTHVQPPVAPINRPDPATSSDPTSTVTPETTAVVQTSTSSIVTSTTSSTTSTSSSTSSDLPTTSMINTPLFTTSTPDVVLVTSSVDAAPSAAATTVTQKNAAMQKTTTTVLIVIASVVVGTAIIWTIIRKWKFGKSDSFEDRMQPIDWQPTNEESGLPVHRRHSNASSFYSAGHNAEDNIPGQGGYGSTSDYGHGNPSLPPLPDHDFTAPSSNLAPVGGYADLARGPSPGPQMQEVPGHGPYGAHDAYDYNGGARY